MAVLAVGLLAGCRGIPPKLDAFYGGNARLIAAAPECDLFRIDPNLTRSNEVETMYRHELLDGPIPIPPACDKRIRAALLDAGTYNLEPKAAVKLCTFEPCLILRYGELDVLVSFACSRVAAYHGGKILGMRDIDPGHNRLLRLMKPLFPDDPYMRLLEPLEE